MTRDEKIIQESFQCWQEQGFLKGVARVAGTALGGAGKLMTGLMNISMLISQAQQIAGTFYKNTKKRCEGVEDKGECITKAKIESLKELIRRLSTSRSKCNQTKDSRACMESINNKISKAREQLRRYEEVLRGEEYA